MKVIKFKIYADYKQSEPHPTYYMMGKDKTKIKKIFESTYTWLKVYDIEEIEYNKEDDYTLDFFSKKYDNNKIKKSSD